jgi:transcription initiation factor TFIID TATA-box-binding protein
LSDQRRPSKLKIVNLVATADLNERVDLEKTLLVDGFSYDSTRYPCAYLKDSKTEGKVSMFSSGKMICAGARSFAGAERDLNYAAKRLLELGLISKVAVDVKLQNIVATADLRHNINLDELVSKLAHVIYEPEQFPGAIYYAEELEGVSILIFANGKLVIAGIRNSEVLDRVAGLLGELEKQI